MKSPAILIGVSTFLLSVGVDASDWPMWRHDARRSGASPEELPDQLSLSWVRQLPAPHLTWPNEPRLHFDAGYMPVVVGKTLFVASGVDGGLTAIDTDSGQVRWKFYSDGPIRPAPVAWREAIYFGSDDGYFYCLDAANGSEKWRVHGAPPDRKEYHHLGNGRLVSFWPVRGGPVVDDATGTVYFGAGIWPSLGIFITAVDARTGKVQWCNRDTHYLDKVRIDHNELHEAGLAPQGHFLLAGGKLVVPNGRSIPARFNPTTGNLLHYVQGYRNGDCRVTATERLLFVGTSGVVDLADGREVGNRWVQAGKNAPARWDSNKRDLFEGPFYPYKFLRACDHRSAVENDVAYGFDDGVIYAYDLASASISLYDKKLGDQTIHPGKWEAPLLWKLNTASAGRKLPTASVIKAGRRIYTHAGKTVLAIDVPRASQAARVAWQHELSAAPTCLLAADDKLFAALQDGTLCCFAGSPTETAEVKTYALPTPSSGERHAAAQQRVSEILRQTGVNAGFAVALGVEGPLVAELARQSDLHVIAVAAEVREVRLLRDRLSAQGLYGQRVEVFRGNPEQFLLPPYLATLMVCQLPVDPATRSELLRQRFQSLRPYGGTMCAFLPPDRDDAIIAEIKGLDLPNAKVRRVGNLLLLQRSGALPGSAAWTHECADAARSFFSHDELVIAPLGILWYGDGPDQGFQKHKDYGRGVKPQVCGGRLFAFNDVEQQLSAVDAYTGRLLWRHETPTSIVRFVSLANAVYVASGTQCEVLDPASGARQVTFSCQVEVPSGRTPGVVGIRATEELLLIALGFDLPAGHSHPAIETGLWDATLLVALERTTGRQLWKYRAKQRINLHAIAIGNGTVFCTDSMAPLQADEIKRRGNLPATSASTTIALDARTGVQKWRITKEYGYRAMTGRGPLAIRPYDDWLAYDAEHDLLLVGKVGQMTAIEAATGKDRWQASGGLQPLILAGDSVIDQAGRRYDIRSGKTVPGPALFQRGGCNYAVGNKSLLFVRNKCAAYIEVDTRKEHSLRNLRSGCSNSLVAADGLLSIPCFASGCVCNYPVQTSLALVHMPAAGDWSEPSKTRN